MEVIKGNFEQHVDSILSAIEKCDFVSLDLEFTGINKGNNQILDYPEERYQKYKQTAEKFKIIQIGLSIFKKISDCNYESKPYKFYVFPEENSGNNLINCETSSLIFNAKQVDFNKWISNGIPYINSLFDKKLSEGIMEGNINLYNPDDKQQFKQIFLNREDDKTKYEEFLKLFNVFYKSDEKVLKCEKYPRYFLIYILNQMSSEIRKKIYFSYENGEDGKSFMLISKFDYKEKLKQLENYKSEKIKEINQRKGFRRIFEKLIEKRAFLIGHNMIHDLLFLISHFGDPIPNSLKDFKTMLRIYFSGYLDNTKLIFEKFSDKLNLEVNEKSNLENVYIVLKSQLNNKVKLTIPDGFTDYNNSVDSYHDAGFDSFVTGACFIFLRELLGNCVYDHSNKIYLMRSVYCCYDLLGDDPILYPNEKTYCLKANMNKNEIDLNKILDPVLYSKVKRIFTNDYNNTLVIFVELESFEMIIEFENKMRNHKGLFQLYNVHQFKEVYSMEENKKKKY